MSTYWKINTRGDPLGALHKFIKSLWAQVNLDVLVIAPSGSKYILDSPKQLDKLNPFSPVMKINTARLAMEAIKKHPSARIGIILRPCEMRALNEMAARGAIQRDLLLTICVDCLGTFPADEFGWRAERAGSAEGLTDESLHFASQGGISAYRYRPACQMCTAPGATEGDVNISIFGLPVRQFMLVNAQNKALALDSITDGQVEEEWVIKHTQMLAKIAERHNNTRSKVLKGLEDTIPSDLNTLIEQFETCGDCQACMDVCPICSVDHPRKTKEGKLAREDLVNWLLSCAGCGMCEQACPKHQPLNVIFSRIREQIEMELA